jgi:hypothetical protein
MASNVPAKADIRNIQKRVQSRTWVLARSEREVVTNDFAEPSAWGRNVGGYWRVKSKKKPASMFDSVQNKNRWLFEA